MRILHTLDQLSSIPAPVVIAAGTFDGVHRGHVAVLESALRRARTIGGQAWALTFDPHPLKILHPSAAPPLITSTQHKLRLLADLKLDGALVLPFSEALAHQEPEDFIASIRASIPKLSAFCIGDNWTFGRKARGDVALLTALARSHGFAVDIVPPVQWKGSTVSSTRIRKAVQHGDLAGAREMLGRPFGILGTVIHGRQVGRSLGFPTANVDPHNEVRPPPGIYAVRVPLDGGTYGGSAYLGGTAPERRSLVVEVHLLDYTGDLYGRDLDVVFEAKLRDDKVFAGRDELVAQIARDVADTRRLLAG